MVSLDGGVLPAQMEPVVERQHSLSLAAGERDARLQVDTRHLATVAGVSTGIATIFVEASSGENMIVIVPGANARLTAAHVTAAEADIAAAGCVVATLELGLAAVTAAMQLGRKVILGSDWSTDRDTDLWLASTASPPS